MQHLSLEVLARLVDEPADAREAEHLADCLVCRRELSALREQTVELSRLADPDPGAGAWDSLEAALLSEGLMRAATPARRRSAFPALRIAASVAIFVGGAAAGAALFRRSEPGPAPRALVTLPTQTGAGRAPLALSAPVTPESTTAPPALPAPVATSTPVAQSTTHPPEAPAARLVASRSAEAPAPRSGARLAASRARPAGDAATAARELADAEAAYVAALRRYAELADPSSGADPVTRLAALETLVETTRRALDRAPGDSIVNGYHLAALDERDELRRKFAAASQSTWF